MRRRWAAGPVLLLVAVLSSCSSTAGSASSSGTGPRPLVASADAAPVGSSVDVASAARRSTGATAAAASRCTTADLRASIPEKPTPGTSQKGIHVTFRNQSSAQCTLYGYPGAEFRSATGDRWDLVRSLGVARRPITLAPGAQAHATLTYLPTDPSDGTGNPVFSPTALVFIPPDEQTSLIVPWTLGPVLRQDAATHPGTYISALEPGS
ncbi:DUF4232 domain-containing protein [Candidatus Frankia alpina]|nr:DUF4232 domain-containing protein [Candidatus Frankia alpina]